MTDQPESHGLSDSTTSDLQERMEWLRKQSEPLDDDTIDLVVMELEKELGKCNRLCNLLLNRPRGIPEASIIATQNIKSSLSQLRWFIERERKLSGVPTEPVSYAP